MNGVSVITEIEGKTFMERQLLYSVEFRTMVRILHVDHRRTDGKASYASIFLDTQMWGQGVGALNVGARAWAPVGPAVNPALTQLTQK